MKGRAWSPTASLGPDGVFVADEVLAKHDEKYMPPEVAKSLKKNEAAYMPGEKGESSAAQAPPRRRRKARRASDGSRAWTIRADPGAAARRRCRRSSVSRVPLRGAIAGSLPSRRRSPASS